MADSDATDDRRADFSRRAFLKGTGAVIAGGIVAPAAAAGAARDGAPAVAGPGATPVTLRVNGVETRIEAEPRATLLDVLRDRLDLTGAKQVCDRGSCGACTVLVDGQPVCSCMMLALDAEGRAITTIEGLSKDGSLTPLQEAFVKHDALQCGYCTSGMVMAGTALLASNPAPSGAEIRAGIAGNICRCGSYVGIFRAIDEAARTGRK